MITNLAFASAALLALQAAPTAPADTTSAAQSQEDTQSEEQAARDNEMICRRTQVTGSRFTKRVCATRKEWQDLADRSRENTAEMQRRGKGLDPNGN